MYANVSLGQCALKRKCFKNRTPGYIHVQRFTSDPALYPFNTLPQSHPVMPHTYRVNSNHSTSPDVESVYRLQSTNIIQITFCRKCEKVPHESLKNPHVMFYEHKQKIGTGNIERLVFFNWLEQNPTKLFDLSWSLILLFDRHTQLMAKVINVKSTHLHIVATTGSSFLFWEQSWLNTVYRCQTQ